MQEKQQGTRQKSREEYQEGTSQESKLEKEKNVGNITATKVDSD